jgi:ABC-type nitrate/sulfonate/bicarbonate transport system ATPase subunit
MRTGRNLQRTYYETAPYDRIVVMTHRPGTIKKDVSVDLPRPRDPSSSGFNDLKKELTQLLMAEQTRHNQALASTGD